MSNRISYTLTAIAGLLAAAILAAVVAVDGNTQIDNSPAAWNIRVVEKNITETEEGVIHSSTSTTAVEVVPSTTTTTTTTTTTIPEPARYSRNEIIELIEDLGYTYVDGGYHGGITGLANSNDKTVTVYTGNTRHNDQMIDRIFAHEVGHVIDFTLVELYGTAWSEEARTEWLDMRGLSLRWNPPLDEDGRVDSRIADWNWGAGDFAEAVSQVMMHDYDINSATVGGAFTEAQLDWVRGWISAAQHGHEFDFGN